MRKEPRTLQDRRFLVKPIRETAGPQNSPREGAGIRVSWCLNQAL